MSWLEGILVGELALPLACCDGIGKEEICSSPSAAAGRVGPAPHLGSTVELALGVGVASELAQRV